LALAEVVVVVVVEAGFEAPLAEPADKIGRPTAVRTFFEGEEEYRSWPKAPREWSLRSQVLTTRGFV